MRTPKFAAAVGLPLVIALPLIAVSTTLLNTYGWTLFVLVPLLVGALSAAVLTCNDPAISFV